MRLRRRTFLAGLLGAISTTAGCTLPTEVTRLDDPLADVQFEEITPRKNRPVGPDREGKKRYPPIVSWDDAASAVRVTGFVFYGGGCDAPVLWEAGLRDDGRLFVSVGHRPKWYVRLPVPVPVGCTGSLGGIHYRVTVRFDDSTSLPTTVEVREDNEAAPDVRRVVDRAEQEALCSADSFEREARRAEAHWTCPDE